MDVRAIFGINVLLSFVSSTIAAAILAWPQLQRMDRNRALVWLTAPHMLLRFVGFSFLVPGVVSPLLPSAFAMPAAYGDMIAGILAIVATVGLTRRAAWAAAAVWLFDVWGAADLLYAFYQGNRVGLDPGTLGAAYFLVTTVVPALLLSHVLGFGVLLRRQAFAREAVSRAI